MCYACAVANKLAFAQGYFSQFNSAPGSMRAHFAAATAATNRADDIGFSRLARFEDASFDMMRMFGKSARDAVVVAERAQPDLLLQNFGKSTTGLEFDGVGDKLNAIGPQPLLVIDPDDIPDDTSTTVTIDVDGDHIISQLHTIGDQDFVKVELVEGQLYQIGQYAYTGPDAPSGIPLADAYIELYDANGNLITEADGGGPNTPSGLDALLTYEADYSGVYYINARAYDETPLDGTNGDAVGDYELFVDNVTGIVEGPHYEPEDLLYSIDWGGVLVDGTARNPDGDEGVRETGNEQGDPDAKGTGITGKNVIKIYFAKPGDVYTPEDPLEPGLPPVAVAVGAQDYEYDAVWVALREFEKVADVVYVETQNREEADFHYVTYTGTPGPGVSLLGSMAPPQTSDEGLALFNSNDERWNEEGLAQGGFSFVTLIHEFGHGHGMAHPHDTGGGSDIMDGVEPDGPVASYTLGDYELNQGVFTMMSYEDGWQSSPYGQAATDAGYGWLGGLMALDIAVIQDKYGVNEEWATGDDSYILKDVNAAGTFFYSIWDAGGTDSIRYKGDHNANIDLRAASLEYEHGGGGWVSYVHGIHGGFTIANAVTIENAVSGAGKDTITGNATDNWILTLGGDDVVFGGAGDDSLSGGSGDDRLFGEHGWDKLKGGAGNDRTAGGPGRDRLLGGADDDLLDGGGDHDVLRGDDGSDRLFGRGGDDFLIGGRGDDTLVGGSGEDVLSGGGDADLLIGNPGSDRLNGGGGNDTLIGGSGDDILNGGGGADLFVFENAFDHDTIKGFEDGIDAISLAGLRDANGGEALSPDQLLVIQKGPTTLIELDLDRNGIADAIDLNGDGSLDSARIYVSNFDAANISAADFVF